MLSLALPFLARTAKTAAKALATAGLSFGTEKLLKKVFGSNIGPQEIHLYRLVQSLASFQKKAIERMLVSQGLVRGGGTAQYGGFLGMLASIAVPIAIDLVSKLLWKGMQVGVSQRCQSLPPPLLPKKSGKRYAHVPSSVLQAMGGL